MFTFMYFGHPSGEITIAADGIVEASKAGYLHAQLCEIEAAGESQSA
jgi:hypothetical protein